MSRVDILLQRALRRLNDEGQHDIHKEDVLAEMNQAQTDLCTDFLAYKVQLTLTMTAAQTRYPLDATIYKVKEFVEPSTWKHRLTLIHDSSKWAEIARNTHLPTSQPLYGFTWNRILNLWQAPPTTGEVLQVFAYALPTADFNIGGDPEINSMWDQALLYGTLAQIVDGIWDTKYQEEASTKAQQNIKESINGPLKIHDSSDRLGF